MNADAMLASGTVEAAKTGDLDALERLYRAWAPAVLGYLRGLATPDPERVLGEVFVSLVRGLDEFVGDEAALQHRLFAVAHRDGVAASRRRHQTHDAAGVAVQAELLAFNRLSRDQRAVLLLRVLAGQSVAGVASILGKDVGVVEKIQRRALSALRRHVSIEAVS